jgi:acyl carrier protein
MEPSIVYEKLTPIFRDLFDDENIVLTPATTADDIDDWDSLNHIRLVLGIQKAFGVKFSANEVGKLKDVGHLVELIRKKL